MSVHTTRQVPQQQHVITCLYILMEEKAEIGLVKGHGFLSSGCEVFTG